MATDNMLRQWHERRTRDLQRIVAIMREIRAAVPPWDMRTESLFDEAMGIYERVETEDRERRRPDGNPWNNPLRTIGDGNRTQRAEPPLGSFVPIPTPAPPHINRC